MGGMGSTRLYQKARFGTKDLVTQYIAELSGALAEGDGDVAMMLAFLSRSTRGIVR